MVVAMEAKRRNQCPTIPKPFRFRTQERAVLKARPEHLKEPDVVQRTERINDHCTEGGREESESAPVQREALQLLEVHAPEQEPEKLLELYYLAAFEAAMQETLKEDSSADLLAAESQIETLKIEKVETENSLKTALHRVLVMEREFESQREDLTKLLYVASFEKEIQETLKDDANAELLAAEFEIKHLKSEKIETEKSLKTALVRVHDKEHEAESLVLDFDNQRKDLMKKLHLAAMEKEIQEIANEENQRKLMSAETKIKMLESQKYDMHVRLEKALRRFEEKEGQLVDSNTQNAATQLQYNELQAEMVALRNEMKSERRDMLVSLALFHQKMEEKEQELEAATAAIQQNAQRLIEMEALRNQMKVKESGKMDMETELQGKVSERDQELMLSAAENVRLKVQCAESAQIVKNGEFLTKESEDGDAGDNINVELTKMSQLEEKAKQNRKLNHKLLNGSWHMAQILKVANLGAENEERRKLRHQSMQHTDERKTLEVKGAMTEATQDERLHKERQSKVRSAVQLAKEKEAVIHNCEEQNGKLIRSDRGGYWPGRNRYRRW